MSDEDKAASDSEKENCLKRSPSFEATWKNFSAGIMPASGHLFKQHETHDEHPVPPGSMKEKVLVFISNWKFEVFIIILILIDLVITSVEMGLDYNLICITPEMVPLEREEIVRVAAEREAAFASYKLQPDGLNGLNTSLAGLWPTLKKEAAKGAMMLQIGTGGVVKLMSATMPAEDVPKRHGMEEESEPDEGHGHAHHPKTLICEGPHGKRQHKIHQFCHVVGLSVLATFIVELMLKAWINLAQFIRSKLQVLDLIIVSVSFTLDFIWPILESRHPEVLETRSDMVRFMMLFMRLMRVVKISHATSEVLHKGFHYANELKEERDKAIEELRKVMKAGLGGKTTKST